jgi:hypothetical protein
MSSRDDGWSDTPQVMESPVEFQTPRGFLLRSEKVLPPLIFVAGFVRIRAFARKRLRSLTTSATETACFVEAKYCTAQAEGDKGLFPTRQIIIR